jgi:DNA-binding beta-propeller fold protein YncE
MSRNAAIGLTGAILLAISVGGAAAGSQPLALEHRFDLPGTIKGHFDHFAIDPVGQRVFGTAVDAHALVVINFHTGQLIKSIPIDTPRGVVYRADLGRLYVSDGAGALLIFDSNTFAPLNSLKIEVDADPVAYDESTQRLFVVNGGEKAKHSYSNITVFDTREAKQLGDIHVDGIEVEGMTVEKSGPRLFANNRDKNEIDIFDRNTLKQLGVWPVSTAKKNTVSALDETRHRLYVAGHQGQLVIIDSDTGKELQTLPIGDGADDIAFDPVKRLIFVAGGGGQGSVDVIRVLDSGHFESLGRIATEPGAATARLVPELGEYVVMVPAAKGRPAQVLVYSVTVD